MVYGFENVLCFLTKGRRLLVKARSLEAQGPPVVRQGCAVEAMWKPVNFARNLVFFATERNRLTWGLLWEESLWSNKLISEKSNQFIITESCVVSSYLHSSSIWRCVYVRQWQPCSSIWFPLRETLESSSPFIADHISSKRLEYKPVGQWLKYEMHYLALYNLFIERTLLNRLRSFVVVASEATPREFRAVP